MKRLEVYLPVFPAVFFIFIAEFLVRLEFLPEYLVPAPSSVLIVLIEGEWELWRAFLSTLVAAFISFMLSAIVGIAVGMFLSSFSFLRKAFLPYAIFFQTVPIVAIAPLLVIWVGYGLPAVIVSSVIVSVFPMIASSLTGFNSAEPQLKELFQMYGASRWCTLIKLRLPSALPHLFTGLRISAGLSVIGVIVGEFIAGGGLGGLIEIARARQRVDQIFAALLLASIIGLGFVGVVNLLSQWFLAKWHPSEKL